MKKWMAIGSIAVTAILIGFSQLGALTLFGEGFDDNNTAMSGWKRGSTTYITRYTGTYKVGDASMQIAGTYTAEVYIKTPIFKNMKLSFKLATYALESTEALYCEYYNGSAWVVAAKMINGQDTGAFTAYTVSLPNVSITKIRFRMEAADTADYGYVDDVVLTGDRW